jgi:hypothetical protein
MSKPIKKIPQPMIGMNWEPAPSNYKKLPAPTEYGDTDFANEDFVALWDKDMSGVGRKDIDTIKGLGCNTIKMYNWSVPAPNGYWMRDHKPFLNAAANAGLSVIIPISNFFTGTAYNNRTNGSNSAAGPAASTHVKSWIKDIVKEVYSNDLKPGPAVMWAIGNEYDNSNIGAYGYCEAEDIAQIATYIMDAEASLSIKSSDVLPFSSPVTTAINPINTGIPQTGVSGTPIMGQYAINSLVSAFKSAGIPADRLVASINSYQTGSQLTGYNTAFPMAFPDMYWYYGELGWSNANGGEKEQAKNIYDQFSTTIPLAKASGSKYLGACCFEFSDELWKGSPGSTETEFGIYTFPPAGSPAAPTAKEGNGDVYPVDQFVARKAVASLKAAIAGDPDPTT